MVIVICGSVASGKSTVAFALADMLARAGTEKVEVFDEHGMAPDIINRFRKTPLKNIAKMLNKNRSGVTIITEQINRKMSDLNVTSLHQRIYHTSYKVKTKEVRNADG